jgi:hypothetical protein
MAVIRARAGELEIDHPFGVVRQLFEPVVARAPDPELLLTGAADHSRHRQARGAR